MLAVVYVIKFTDWFEEKNIHILYRLHRSKPFFGLENRQYELTSVKVYRSDELSTNKYARPLWHIVASTNAQPVSDFMYGQKLKGMKPAVPGLDPEPLEKNVTYRIIVEAGKLKGEKEFAIR